MNVGDRPQALLTFADLRHVKGAPYWRGRLIVKYLPFSIRAVMASSWGVIGDTIVVGAPQESSNQTTITNGTAASADNSAAGAPRRKCPKCGNLDTALSSC